MNNSPPLTEDDLNNIEERAAQSTPGPWFLRPDEAGDLTKIGWEAHVNDRGRDDYYEIAEVSDQCFWEADARFITSAREDVPRLISEVRMLRERLRLVEID